MEKDYRTSSNLHRYINIVESIVPYSPPKIQCRDDLGIHEFDIAMANVSIEMSQDLMVDRLIIKVRVKRTRSGFTTYTYKRHRRISANLLAIKWRVVLDKAKRTLQSTTQDNVRSALKPLTRRYRKYLLSQRLCRLNCIFIQTHYLQRTNPQLGIHVIRYSPMGNLFKGFL